MHQIGLSWSQRSACFPVLFEALAVDWMREASLSAVCRLLGTSWSVAAGIQEWAVGHGLERLYVLGSYLFPLQSG